MTKRLTLVTLVVLVLCSVTPRAQGGFAATATVTGSLASISWTAFAGAAGYRLGVGTVQGGSNLASLILLGQSVGPVAIPTGEYFARVDALDAVGTVLARTAEISFIVGTPKPGTPQTFAASLEGPQLTFNWTAPGTGGPASGYIASIGTQFGADNLVPGASFGGGTSAAFNIGGLLPAGTYFGRLYAANAAGVSEASDEAIFTVGTAVPGVPVPQIVQVNGNQATLSWLPPAGGAPVTEYQIEGALNDPRAIGVALRVPASTTSITVPLPPSQYYWRVRAFSGATPGGVFGLTTFAVGQTGVTERRLPNPKLGRRLPFPSYGASVVAQVAAAYPAQFRNSCLEHGGNNAWLYLLVRELRKIDTRWGLNWKRGGVGDMSQDIVAYNFGSLPDEGTTEVYIIDTIGGHCGNNPDPNFADVTEATRRGGAIGRYTLQPYLAAGLPLIP